MNKLYLLLVFLLPTFIDIQGQVVAVKTNVLYDAITTPNIGAEVAFNKHWSVEASGYYNGWTFSSDKSFKHWMIQPEARYWIHERFNGHFFGVHAQYIDYDFAGLKLLYGMEKKNSYNGNAYGGGISYGVIGLGVESRWGSCKFKSFGGGDSEEDEQEPEPGKSKFNGMRVYLSFRF